MKFYFFILIIVIINLSSFSYALRSNLGLETNLQNRHKKFRKISLKDLINKVPQNKTIHYAKQENIPLRDLNGDVYWQGWVKYFHYNYDNGDISQPKSFYENPDYFTQLVNAKKYENKDEKGHRIHIPGKNYFWAKLLANSNLDILSSRKDEDNTNAHLIENLNTDLIQFVNPDDNANGAIKSLGNFKEGSCIRVNLNVPSAKKEPNYNSRTADGQHTTWVICVDKDQKKKELQEYLVSLKLKRQKDIDDVLTEVKPKDPNEAKSASEIMGNKSSKPAVRKYTGPDASPDDGYFILLQDWSECSLKCGGGTMTQQWMCVPPKNKGKACPGDDIWTKKCNEHACPSAQLTSSITPPSKDNRHVNLPPLYKALPYSNRPQQYVKCFIKENDVLYKSKEYDPLKRNDVKVPGRIIMNTQTIAVYRDESFNSALFTFNLQDTVFKYSNTDHCCFFLINANRQYEMCGFNNNCGSKANPIWAKGWSYDFDYFQKKCFRDLKENQLDLPPPPVMLKTKVNSNQPGLGKTSVSIHLPSSVNNNQLLPGVADAAKDIVGARKQAIEQEIDKNAETELDKKVQETQKVSLTAIRREINLEDMIKDEENQKGQDEVRELTVQVQQEKKKKQVLEQALQMREKSYEKVKSTKTVQKQIESIKQEAKVDIKFKRAVLKQKIAQIRAKSKRKSRLLQQQINLIRSEMAEEIMAANKKGNAKQCYEDRNDLAKISYYCNNNFSDDYIKNNSCKDAGNFCYNCCENEFGNMYIDQRDDCQSKCDDLEKEELKDGDWVWSKDAENTPTAPMAKTASDANTNVVSNTSTITTNTNIINN